MSYTLKMKKVQTKKTHLYPSPVDLGITFVFRLGRLRKHICIQAWQTKETHLYPGPVD